MVNNFVEWVRSMLAPPTDLVIAARNLEEHKRRLLDAKSSRSYADKMVLFHQEQIKELTERLEAEQ